jgi:ATP-dependent helicase/nuclease subunit A
MNNNIIPGDLEARKIVLNVLNKNLLVEAGAGSGKTTILIDRIVALLKKKEMEIGQLAAITFTRKAAAEMRERLQLRLEKEVIDSGNEAIVKALTNLNQAYVGTIHSFCAKLLRSRPVEANIDPAFEELEGTEEELLHDAAWDDFIQEANTMESQLNGQLRSAGVDIAELKKSFTRLIAYPEVEFPFDLVPIPVTKEWREKFLQEMHFLINSVPQVVPENDWDKAQTRLRYIDRMMKYRDMRNEKEFFEILQECESKFDVTQNRWESKELAKEVILRLENLRKEVVSPALTAWREYRYGLCMSVLFPAVKKCQEKRLKESKLNFQDLLMLTAKMLRDHPEVRKYFADRHTKIFVDEFQDTDPIQAEIVFLLAGKNPKEINWKKTDPVPGSLFIVGDQKQSIYRFRRADIDTYNEVKGLIEKSGGEILQLTSNFRSSDLITGGLNRVFKSIFPKEGTGEQAPYADLVAELTAKTSPHRGIRKLSVRDLADTKNRTVAVADADKIAMFIDSSLKGRMKIQRVEKISTAATPGDFLILLYQKRDIDAYAKALEARGIPYEISGGNGFADSEYLKSLIDLMKCLNDSADQILLFKTLRGLFFGISDDQFYQFKLSGGHLSFFSSFDGLKDSEQHRDVVSSLELVRKYWKYTQDYAPAVAIELICEDLGILAFAASGDQSGSSVGNIAKTFELLRSSPLINSFSAAVDYLELLFESGVVEEFSINSTKADVVRLMNLHKAKGLESPIVFLANPTSYKIFQPSARVERNGEKAVGYIEIRKIKGEYQSELVACPLNWQKYQQIESAFDSAEKERLLYVAATRAKDLLVISTNADKPESNPWNRILAGLENIPELEIPPVENYIADDKTGFEVERFEKFKRDLLISISTISEKSYDTATVTSLSHKDAPMPMWTNSGNGMRWGTVVHRLLMICKDGLPGDMDLIIKNILAEEEVIIDRLEDVKKLIQSITTSPLWERMKNASVSMAEVPFVLRSDSALDSGKAKIPTVISGAIDLLFKEKGAWVIVDYKTDSVTDDLSSWVNYYKPQIDLYAKKWEEMTGEKVSEKILYFTSINRMVHC